MSTEKLSELSKPVNFLKSAARIEAENFERWSKLAALTSESSSVLHSTTLLETSQLLSALLARIEELEWRELNSTELKELLTWHPTESSAATDPILWAAMRNKINFTLAWVAADEAKKEQSNG